MVDVEKMAASDKGFIFTHSWFLFPVGLYVVIRVSVSVIGSLLYLYHTYLKSSLYTEDLKQKFGPWAAVTGCTSGIGEHLVHELAAHGLNLVLVSRSASKLRRQAADTERRYGVETRVVPVDYLRRDACREALAGLRELDVGLLVNNVGLNTDTGSRRLDEMAVREVRDMVVVNCGAAALMTHGLLPHMLRRRRGHVLNVGSTSGYLALPYQALYCATKSYMRVWSLAADEEAGGRGGVSVRCSLPQFVRTGMSRGNSVIYNFPVWTCDPRVYARSCLRSIHAVDCGGNIVYDFMLWFDKAVVSLLRPEVEIPIIYFITNLILPYSSKIED